MDTGDVQFVDCDTELKRRVGQVMGEVAERHIRLSGGFAFVAMDRETPVGLIAVYTQLLPPPLSGIYEGSINTTEVAEAYRRRGIDKRLVEMSIERCRTQGLHQTRAWSSEDQSEAIPMCKALGFALCPATEHPGGLDVKGYFAAHQV